MLRCKENFSEEEINLKVLEFQDWIKDQAQLPQKLGNYSLHLDKSSD